MAKCSFCRNTIEKGKGTMFIKNDGSTMNFCSTKCQKSLLKLKRDPAKTPWTKLYQKNKKGGKK